MSIKDVQGEGSDQNWMIVDRHKGRVVILIFDFFNGRLK